jgi:hypothetical protein
VQANLIALRKIEAAKHQLFYTLLKLRLPLAPMDGIAGENLIFDFLATGQQGGRKVMTGHHDGLITLALDEAIQWGLDFNLPRRGPFFAAPECRYRSGQCCAAGVHPRGANVRRFPRGWP